MRNSKVKDVFLLYLAAGWGAFLSLYTGFEYVIFKKKYEETLLRAAQQFENRFFDVISTHKEVLQKISHKI